MIEFINDTHIVGVGKGVYDEKLIDRNGVEYVPVVRCKECRYCDDTQWCEWVTRYITSNGFCAWGERREDNG